MTPTTPDTDVVALVQGADAWNAERKTAPFGSRYEWMRAHLLCSSSALVQATASRTSAYSVLGSNELKSCSQYLHRCSRYTSVFCIWVSEARYLMEEIR